MPFPPRAAPRVRHSCSETALGLSLTARPRDAVDRWLTTQVLVIDEVSMIDGKLFTALAAIGRAVRGGSAAWGGLQLVLTGDFLQLPPVRRAGCASSLPTWAIRTATKARAF